MIRRYLEVGGLVCLVSLGAPAADAASIGISFMSNRDPAAVLLAGEVAGVDGVAQSNWNNTSGGTSASDGAVGTEADILSPVYGVLSDSDGAATTTTTNWIGRGTWNTTNGVDTPDAKLMNGYIDAIDADGDVTIDFASIPYDIYDVYVYFGSDGNGRTGFVTDGTTTYSYSTFSNDPFGGGGFAPTDYVQTTDLTGGFPSSNYAVFAGLTGTSASFSIIRGSNNSGIHAIQIVDRSVVPEPSILAMLAFSSLVARRRRRRSVHRTER